MPQKQPAAPATVKHAEKENGEAIDDAGSVNQVQMQYDGGTTRNETVSWTPVEWQVFGETSNYALPDKGEHVPGDTRNKIRANDIESRKNGFWSAGTVSPTSEENGKVSSISGGFKVWDRRCSE